MQEKNDKTQQKCFGLLEGRRSLCGGDHLKEPTTQPDEFLRPD